MTQLFLNQEPSDYEINEQGEIYSHKTKKILTGSIANTGYRMVQLTSKDGNKKGYAIHRLVAETFLPNPDNLPVVNHIDGNKLNNTLENLEWVSQSDNRKHAIETKISDLAYGKRKKLSQDSLKEDDWKRYQNSSYLISKWGQVYNEKTQTLLKATPNQSGYVRYTLRIDGKNCSKLAHSLVINAWLGISPATNEVINHKDGNKANNYLNNLEIITKSENTKHACYSLSKLVKPVVEIKPDGRQIEYPSISEAARQIGVSDGAIRCALKLGSKCHLSNWVYK